MNLEDITDGQTTTKKMRIALRGGDTKKAVKQLSKQKNPDPNVQAQNAAMRADTYTDGDSDVTDDQSVVD